MKGVSKNGGRLYTTLPVLRMILDPVSLCSGLLRRSLWLVGEASPDDRCT